MQTKLFSSIRARLHQLLKACLLTVSIRIVADCMVLSCHVTEKLKQVKSLKFTTISAIIFIHLCVFVHD